MKCSDTHTHNADFLLLRNEACCEGIWKHAASKRYMGWIQDNKWGTAVLNYCRRPQKHLRKETAGK